MRNISIVSMQQLAMPAGAADPPSAAVPAPAPTPAPAAPQSPDWATIGKGIGMSGPSGCPYYLQLGLVSGKHYGPIIRR